MGEYNCSQDLENLGNLKCQSLWGIERRLILCLRTKSDGTNNEFATVSAFTKSALQAKFDNTDSLNRYYPTKEISNVEPTVGDPVAPTDDYGKIFFQRYGIISRKAMGWGWTNKYIAKLSSFNNNEDLAAFPVFSNGCIGYLTDAETELKVMPIPLKGFMATPMIDGDKVHKCSLSYQFDLEGNENNLLRVIDAKDLDFEALSANDVYALDDVTLTVSAPTVAGFTITAKIMGRDELPLRGLVVADLVLTDDADGAETITTLTETATPGVYTAAATLTADGYKLTGSKKKYSFNTATFTVSA